MFASKKIAMKTDTISTSESSGDKNTAYLPKRRVYETSTTDNAQR
jgi:hypothetical protein